MDTGDLIDAVRAHRAGELRYRGRDGVDTRLVHPHALYRTAREALDSIIRERTLRAGAPDGINPIWYVDMTPGQDWTLRNALTALRDDAQSTGAFHDQPIEWVREVRELCTWDERPFLRPHAVHT